MTESQPPQRPHPRKPLLIENVHEKETSESLVERHFPDRCFHRAKDSAEFDVNGIVEKFGTDLIRSFQDIEVNPEGQGFAPVWSTLLFQRPNNVFWHLSAKSNNYGSKPGERIYSLAVTAGTPAAAVADALMLRDSFTVSESAPGFFLVRDIKHVKRIPLRAEFLLSPEDLNLHYGDGCADWSSEFAAGLTQNGLSILRGKPGTGKTSYLRHLIHSLASSHRFYYLPVDAFSLLQHQMADFLIREQKRFPESTLVLVLEDAEQLLLNRQNYRDGLASSLLNFTDGFIGDMVRCHLVCTINSEIKELNAAVLRPGRQRFFREFDFIPWPRALALAQRLNIELTEERDYSLAELYHFRDTQNSALARSNTSRSIGF